MRGHNPVSLVGTWDLINHHTWYARIPGSPRTLVSDACATLSPCVPCIMHWFGKSASATASGKVLRTKDRRLTHSFIPQANINPYQNQSHGPKSINLHRHPTFRQVNPQYCHTQQDSFTLNQTQGSVVKSTVQSKTLHVFGRLYFVPA